MALFEKKLLKQEIQEALKHLKKEYVTKTDILKDYGSFMFTPTSELKTRKCKACPIEYLPEKPNYTLCPKCYQNYQYIYLSKQRYVYLKRQIRGKPYFTIVFCEQCEEPYVISKSLLHRTKQVCKSCIEANGRDSRIRTYLGQRSQILTSLGNKCTRCENNDIKILHIHHKDRTNNNRDNLELLCPNCHRSEHVRGKLCLNK